MKRYSIKFSIAALVLAASACNLLDKDIDTNLSKEDIFSDERYAVGFINSAYADMINGFDRLDGSMFACATDEAFCSNPASSVHGFNNGAINPSYNPEEIIWKNMYSGIRKANTFLAELNGIIASSGLIDKDKNSKAAYSRMKGEAFFLRGLYHFELAKRWGNIQLVDTVLDDKSVLTVKQSNFAEAIEFIKNDCDSAWVYLDDALKPISDEKKGRATKASALALKSRALLYLASPWSNKTNDRKLWADAADASWEIISTGGSRIALDPTTLAPTAPTLAYISTPFSKEVLFASSYPNQNQIEINNLPVSFMGQGYTNPTQELIDCFEILKGKKYDEKKPYANRDYRFNLYFYYNAQRPMSNKKDSVFTYIGGKDGQGNSSTATKTGYYMRKYTDFSLDLSKGQVSRRGWIFFRLGEIILNYCEAKNESLEISENDKVSESTIYQQLNKLRKRGGVVEYTIGSLTKKQMREAIHNERRIELAFEEHRFWDVRRWQEGEIYFNGPIHGMEITKNSDDTYNYKKIVVENRVYNSKMDWYPIPYMELIKNPNLKQNPGWE